MPPGRGEPGGSSRPERHHPHGDGRALAGNDLATKADLNRVELSLTRELADLKQDLSRTFATWLFLSQGVMVAIVGRLVTLR